MMVVVAAVMVGDGGCKSSDPNFSSEDTGEFFLCEIDGTKVKETRGQIPLAIQKRSDVYGVVGKGAHLTDGW
ncbi:hypothetical protein C366_05030 [Cryptococcus neoformans Tu401-1]|nr:hypothetical protein C365_04742 [Cryptococcus neoformans var. grubii Bt85]OXG14036.1 hypothetical protein C366_05030 [Cryptococcus neoformans var. grubii Tu401-1]OXM77455.1 hypothetical protein C364_05017 [Cryptococcus neoformans var. grubii Bt63]